MGKKHIIETNQEESIKEQEKIDKTAVKEVKKSRGPEGHSAGGPQGGPQTGKIYISSSYNNTIITLTDNQGNVLAWVSAGAIGFKGSKKATPFAASKVAEAIVQTIKKLGIQKLAVFVKGIGSGRESAIRSLAARDLDIVSITDVTPVPHNGCRPPKVRRV